MDDNHTSAEQTSKSQNYVLQNFGARVAVDARDLLLVQSCELKMRTENGNHPSQQHQMDAWHKPLRAKCFLS